MNADKYLWKSVFICVPFIHVTAVGGADVASFENGTQIILIFLIMVMSRSDHFVYR